MTQIVSQPLRGQPIVDGNGNSSRDLEGFFDDLVINFNALEAQINPVPLLPQFTVGTVPAPSSANRGGQIYITDETGGEVPAFSDGINWRRGTDRAIISV